MGVARVECRSGCKCEPTKIDATWKDQVSLQQIHMFRVSGCRGRVGGRGGRQAGPSESAQLWLAPPRTAGAFLPATGHLGTSSRLAARLRRCPSTRNAWCG